MAYTNSSLVTYKRLTNNRTSPRNHAIDTITIHCIVVKPRRVVFNFFAGFHIDG